jgi:hypothetical protein
MRTCPCCIQRCPRTRTPSVHHSSHQHCSWRFQQWVMMVVVVVVVVAVGMQVQVLMPALTPWQLPPRSDSPWRVWSLAATRACCMYALHAPARMTTFRTSTCLTHIFISGAG